MDNQDSSPYPADAEEVRSNYFDVTKVWPHSEVKLREVSVSRSNRSPQNHFAEIELLALALVHLVLRIELNVDPMPQACLVSYVDSQRPKLGANYQQISVTHLYIRRYRPT